MANTVDTMTPEEILREIIDGTLTELEDDGVTAISARKFYQRTALTRASFPNFGGAIGEYSFYGCTNLESINAPGVTSIGQYAFNGCTSLESANVPCSGGIGTYAFNGCSDLSSLNISSNATSIGAYAFSGCTSLTGTLDLPKVSSVGGYSFQNTKVKSIIMTSNDLVGIAANAFRNCPELETVYFGANACLGSSAGTIFYNCPKLKGVVLRGTRWGGPQTSCFGNCSSMVYMDWTFTGTIPATTFANCSSLVNLILRRTAVTPLNSTGVFSGTPFASGGSGGTLHVPKAQVASYKSASNWSTILAYPNNMVIPIEGSIFQTEYGDGRAISSATPSDAKHWVIEWGVAIAGNGDNVPYTSKSSARAMFIALRGDNSIKLNSSAGKDTFVYPIEIQNGSTGFTVTSDDLDFYVMEVKYSNDDWNEVTNSGWLLQSSNSSHSYTISNQNTTHIVISARIAGDTGNTGTVTQTMLNSITFAWNS